MSRLKAHSLSFASQYRIGKLLGAGGMGEVYLADQVGAAGFLKRVAIKTILPELNSEEQLEIFKGEAHLVANLVHPNIVQIYQLGQTDEFFFIVMEYIDGINLHQFMERHLELGRRVPTELATFIVSRVSRALEYAHFRTDERGEPLGLVHRDVSPRNIMISREGEVKLTDFGSAKALNYLESREGEVLMGKVEYMAPEQARCQSTGPRSDIYSLGVVFAELLSGRQPFRPDGQMSINEALVKVVQEPFPSVLELNSGVPDDLAVIVDRCTRPKPEQRYPDARELSYTLEHHLYDPGYGPTIMTLSNYLSHTFPELFELPI